MADKAISELVAASSVTPDSLFVMQQDNTAKKLTAQVLENWLVSLADGHGGIQSIVKKNTSGLVDTYRITLADTTTFDFMVTNGKSITGIAKTGTSGLVDTYKISYNDGSSQTYTVTNGAKGDKGDNAYVWIKYASQEPTEATHSMGDIPDAWVGIYSGSSTTAPTDYTQYKWYKIKGEKGDTGDPATITSISVTYQASDSGTITPSGTWVSSVPVVAQGEYLWTRVTQTYNTGTTVVSYSVSRMGIDGSGSVSSVNDVSPDAAGNVQLTPDSIGAEAKKKYGKLVVFGDSLGEGANNNMYSFVDILSESGMFSSVVKACVSSASIGPYQLDSNARGYDLNSQIERYASDIRDADIIICEYCGNDIVALLNGNIEMGTASDSATTTTICGYTRKAISRIYELNPDVTIQWVHFGETDYDVMTMGGYYYNFSDDMADGFLLFAAEALKVVKALGCRLMKIYFWSHEGYLSDDEVHPNMAGHTYIASTIANNLPCDEDIGHLTRPLTLTGDLVGNKNLSFDGEFGLIHKLISGGVDVPVRTSLDGMTIFFHVISIEDQCVTFLTQSHEGALISVGWNSDGSIRLMYVPAGATSAPTTGSCTIDGTYAATNNNNFCTYVKSGNVVSVQLNVEVKSGVTQTWQELKVASGLPNAVANTAGMAFYQGYTEFLQIIATTSGEIKLLPMTSPSSKTVRGQLVYIATE